VSHSLMPANWVSVFFVCICQVTKPDAMSSGNSLKFLLWKLVNFIYFTCASQLSTSSEYRSQEIQVVLGQRII
jgi:hypothetical protein